MPNKSSPHGVSLIEGAISSGTLRTQDLLRTFADAYERIVPFNSHRLVFEARELADLLDADDTGKVLHSSASDVLAELCDVLGECAAREGMWFGPCEGDGACFGFWFNDDADAA